MSENTSPTPESQPPPPEDFSYLQPLPDETPQAFEALMIHYNSDQKLTPPKIAEVLGVHPHTVYNWSSKYHWKDRILRHRARWFSYQERSQHAIREAQTQAEIEVTRMVKDSKVRKFRKFDAATDAFLDEYIAKGLPNLRLGEFTQFCSLNNRIGDSLLPTPKSQPAATESQLKAADDRYFEEVSKAWHATEQSPTPQDPPPPQDPPANPEQPKTR